MSSHPEVTQEPTKSDHIGTEGSTGTQDIPRDLGALVKDQVLEQKMLECSYHLGY